MVTYKETKIEMARELMKGFSGRTGLSGDRSREGNRYLWTDAFAVQTFFGLSNSLNDESYREKALRLIDLVHENLGKFHPDDGRTGWISGLPEEEARRHPTAGGLRIGKKMPERGTDEAFNERLEWDRDGQYFHYLTRWFNALLQAWQETGQQRFAEWAAELMLASENFINEDRGRLRMYWKMSTDLSRPLVPSMGAHDPLEGMICTKSAEEASPKKEPELEMLSRRFAILCADREWDTTDPLGIGGLLLNTLRAAGLVQSKEELPQSVQPLKLYQEALSSLRTYSEQHVPGASANRRLAFRECGLSLGIRALYGMKAEIKDPALKLKVLHKYLFMADDIENFWSDPMNRQVSTWRDHLDINAVSLAASLVASSYPEAFSGFQHP